MKPIAAQERIISTPDAMLAFGREVAGWCEPGDLLILDGPLGAGKTTFTRGLGEGLGVRGAVSSPTFVIARFHPGPLPLLHVDAYRLGSPTELDDLDLEHDTASCVTVVEWGRGMAEGLADAPLVISIERRDDDTRRVVIGTGAGEGAIVPS
jgi:tRNA threonylcarbamoyladenosine biosynthesis protein TsaE